MGSPQRPGGPEPRPARGGAPFAPRPAPEPWSPAAPSKTALVLLVGAHVASESDLAELRACLARVAAEQVAAPTAVAVSWSAADDRLRAAAREDLAPPDDGGSFAFFATERPRPATAAEHYAGLCEGLAGASDDDRDVWVFFADVASVAHPRRTLELGRAVALAPPAFDAVAAPWRAVAPRGADPRRAADVDALVAARAAGPAGRLADAARVHGADAEHFALRLPLALKFFRAAKAAVLADGARGRDLLARFLESTPAFVSPALPAFGACWFHLPRRPAGGRRAAAFAAATLAAAMPGAGPADAATYEAVVAVWLEASQRAVARAVVAGATLAVADLGDLGCEVLGALAAARVPASLPRVHARCAAETLPALLEDAAGFGLDVEAPPALLLEDARFVAARTAAAAAAAGARGGPARRGPWVEALAAAQVRLLRRAADDVAAAGARGGRRADAVPLFARLDGLLEELLG